MAEDFARRWQTHHGGVSVQANVWIRGWLAVVVGPARLLAKWRVSPSLLTLFGLAFSLATIWVSIAGVTRWHLIGCAVLVLLSSYLDGLDGAVAIMRNKVSELGSRLDRVSDRLSEMAWLLMFVFFGVPIWLALMALAAAWVYEWLRWRSSKSDRLVAGRVTVAERPVRVVIVVMFLLAAAVFIGWAQVWLVMAMIGWVGVCLIGSWQVTRGF